MPTPVFRTPRRIIAQGIQAIDRLTLVDVATAAADAVHAAITGSASVVVVTTTAITNPDVARCLIITPGGTTADVAAMSITVVGTDINGDALTEDFAFLANATAATTGLKAFKTVTSISIPVQDGAAATFTIGTTDKLGLRYVMDANTVLFVNVDGARDSALPTVTYSATVLAQNTADPATAANASKDFEIVYIYA